MKCLPELPCFLALGVSVKQSSNEIHWLVKLANLQELTSV